MGNTQIAGRKAGSWQRWGRLLASIQAFLCVPLANHASRQVKTDFGSSFGSPRYHPFRRHLLSLRRELNSAVTHAVAVICVLLLIVFVLGAESSFRGSGYPGTSANRFSKALLSEAPSSPVERQLHEYHSVPRKYLESMTVEQKHALLVLLSSHATNFTLGCSTRRAVFTRITECNLHSCLRALASAVAYAQTTGRVAAIFVASIGNRPITDFVHVQESGLLNNDAIVIPMNKDLADFRHNKGSQAVDWTELTVVEAVAPSSLPKNNTMSANSAISVVESGSPKVSTSSSVSEETGGLPKIGNTDELATLDNLAAIDTHVSLSLSEVVWSRYAPRTIQEGLFEGDITAASGVSGKLIARASILGRHRHTRDIKRVDKALRGTYKVPQMLLTGMSPLGRKLLFLKLMSKRRKGNEDPRVMFVHAQYGLGNRLRALGSAMAFARRTDRVLVVIWVPDQHLNCRYTDLFAANDEFVVSDAFAPREEWPFKTNFAADENMKKVKWYNFMRVNGIQVNSSSDPVTDDKEHHIYVSTCYVIQSPVTPFIIRTTSSYWQVLRSLTPHVDVVRLVDRFASYPLSTMIGIHIRGKSIKTDISGVSANDYTEESSRTTDYWRNLTQVDTFVEEMRRQAPDQLFYVAADSKEVFGRLEKEFPSRVFYTPRHCDSRDRRCLPFALADILLLAKCSSLRGSYWSSFSELSTRIGGARFLLAGIDFGRPERHLF